MGGVWLQRAESEGGGLTKNRVFEVKELQLEAETQHRWGGGGLKCTNLDDGGFSVFQGEEG